MTQANVNDRTTVEQVYPREQFELDVRANARAKEPVQRGVRIVSPPDGEGRFDLVPASRHTGEQDGVRDAVFLAPYETFDALKQNATDYGEAVEKGNAIEEVRNSADVYDAFIGKIIETARTAEFEPPVGRHSDVLRGFRGG